MDQAADGVWLVTGTWSRRDNFTDGFTFSDFRLQFSFRYSFSFSLGG